MAQLSLRFNRAEVEQLRTVLGNGATKAVIKDMTTRLSRHTTTTDEGETSRMMAALKPGSEVTAETVATLRQALQQRTETLHALLPVLEEDGTHTHEQLQQLQQADAMLAAVDQQLGSAQDVTPTESTTEAPSLQGEGPTQILDE